MIFVFLLMLGGLLHQVSTLGDKDESDPGR
jgi:hypothetical protein